MILCIQGVEAPAFRHLGQHNLGFEVRVLPRSYAVVTDMGRGVTGNGGDGSFGRLARFIGVFGTPENGKAKPIAMTAPVVTEAPSPAPTKIAMTAPVVSQQPSGGGGGNATMAFLLPSKFAAEHATVGTLPQPSNPAVRLREVPEAVVAVTSFRGYVSEAKVRTKLRALRCMLRAADLREVKSGSPPPSPAGTAAAAAEAAAAAAAAAAQERELELDDYELGELGLGAPCEWRLAQYHPPFTLPWFRVNEIWVTLRDSEAEVAARLAAADPKASPVQQRNDEGKGAGGIEGLGAASAVTTM